ncbi:hypothetical protein ACZ90_01200 [Streptomyces albus subsp. albus]|nr:hypothetical protein ACZ90_01200 [Streptomyces albus subsp. albus]
MSQQGERRGREDDWWRELYEADADDTGPGRAGDSLDERLDSALRAVGVPPPTEPGAPERRRPEPAPPEPALREPEPAAPPPESGADSARAPAAREPVMPAPAPEAVMPAPEAAVPRPKAAVPEPRADAMHEPAVSGTAAPVPVPEPDRQLPVSGPAVPSRRPAAPGPAPRADAAPGPAPGAGVVSEPAPPPRAPARPATGSADSVWRPPRQRGGTPPPGGDREDVPAQAAFVGDRAPTYDAEPTALPPADPADLADLVPDTVLDGACYGPLTLRAASLRGDSARFRGEPRRDALLTARFGTGTSALLLVAVASGARAAAGAHRAARELCEGIGGAVGRSQARLAEDIREGRRAALKSGLHRLTDRGLGRLRSRAAELGLHPAEYTASLHCLLLPADPHCRTRVFFGAGPGGLFRLRDGAWHDLEPAGRQAAERPGPPPEEGAAEAAAPAPPGDAAPEFPLDGDPFRFRASVARPGDVLLLCSSGLAEPLRGETALARRLGERWAGAEPPGLAGFLADAQIRVKGYADDRTAAAVWEA